MIFVSDENRNIIKVENYLILRLENSLEVTKIDFENWKKEKNYNYNINEILLNTWWTYLLYKKEKYIFKLYY